MCERDFIVNNTERRISQSTIESIVRLHESGQSERSIKGKNKWYSRTLLPRFQKFVAEGGSREQKWKSIDDYVDNKVQEAHAANLPIHEYMLRQWAIERADEIGADDFTASRHWIHDFKQRHPLVSRAVTGYRSRAERNRAEQIKESIEEFQRQYGAIRHHFPYRLIWNMDQSPFAYEVSNKRSLAPRGCRDVILDIDSKNKNTHSYTSQPTISRDGKLVGKLLLCLQEDDNKFGPRVERQVRVLESQLGNIKVVCSTSGKMTSKLIREWVDDIVQPAMNATMEPHDGETECSDNSETDVCFSSESQGSGPVARPSWASSHAAALSDEQRQILHTRNSSNQYIARPDLLLLTDAWGGHSSSDFENYLAGLRIARLKIPEHTTGHLQPLDVTFFRQYKKFWKKIQEAALYQNMTSEITSRLGVINMHGLMWDQFHSPLYRDMLSYAWLNTDADYSADELENGEPVAMVESIQFNLGRHSNCRVEGCEHRAFIRCAHCGKLLCLEHFLNRTCLHLIEANNGSTSSATTSRPRPRDRDDDDSSGSGAGAIAGVALTGSAIGIGGGAVGAASAAASGAISGTSSIAGSSGSDSLQAKIHEEHEMRPLLGPFMARPEEVIVYQPSFPYDELIRDNRKRGLAPRC